MGIQSELEVSGGFELSQPRSIEQRSSTPTKRPVSASVTVGWVSSPKSEVSECSLLLIPLHLLMKGLFLLCIPFRAFILLLSMLLHTRRKS